MEEEKCLAVTATFNLAVLATELPEDDADFALALKLQEEEERFRQSETGVPVNEDTSSDLELARQLQAQLDAEYHAEMDQLDRAANVGAPSKLIVRSQRQQTTNDAEQYFPTVSSEDEAEIFEDEPQPVFYDKGTKCMRDTSGVIVTKHNAVEASRLNRQRIEGQFPISFQSGDLKSSKGRDITVTNRVYNQLKRFAVKDARHAARLHEKKDHSTVEMAMDKTTRLLVFRLVNGGLLESVHGVVSTGKESVIFCAEARELPAEEYVDGEEDVTSETEEDSLEREDSTDAALATHGLTRPAKKTITPQHSPVDPDECPIIPVALKVFKTTLTEFTQRQQFLHGDPRYEHRVGRQHARKLVKLWAEKEFANLHRMRRAGMNCPLPLFQRQHVLAMSMIGGETPAPKLKAVCWSRGALQSCYDQVQEQMHMMYNDCRLVHCDLSEYNILWHDRKPWIIDVGQSVEVTHPRSLEYLYRDCVNIVRFFTSQGLDCFGDAAQLYKSICGQPISRELSAEYTMKIGMPGRGRIKTHEKAVDAEETSNIVLRFAQPITLESLEGVELGSENDSESTEESAPEDPATEEQ
jgi:RIO kinase 3